MAQQKFILDEQGRKQKVGPFGLALCKRGIYKGIRCDSSWELAFVVWHMEHGKSIRRCTERWPYDMNGKRHIYCPDFVTDEGIIEVKGCKGKTWKYKAAAFPNVKVYFGKDMQHMLDYVTDKYGKDFCDVLYDVSYNRFVE